MFPWPLPSESQPSLHLLQTRCTAMQLFVTAGPARVRSPKSGKGQSAFCHVRYARNRRPQRLRGRSIENFECPLAPDQLQRTPRLYRATRSRSCDQSLLLSYLWYSYRSRDGDEGHNGFLDADAAMRNCPFPFANEGAERRGYQGEIVVGQPDTRPKDRARVVGSDIGSQ